MQGGRGRRCGEILVAVWVLVLVGSGAAGYLTAQGGSALPPLPPSQWNPGEEPAANPPSTSAYPPDATEVGGEELLPARLGRGGAVPDAGGQRGPAGSKTTVNTGTDPAAEPGGSGAVPTKPEPAPGSPPTRTAPDSAATERPPDLRGPPAGETTAEPDSPPGETAPPTPGEPPDTPQDGDSSSPASTTAASTTAGSAGSAAPAGSATAEDSAGEPDRSAPESPSGESAPEHSEHLTDGTTDTTTGAATSTADAGAPPADTTSGIRETPATGSETALGDTPAGASGRGTASGP